jgi:hypothetical protein
MVADGFCVVSGLFGIADNGIYSGTGMHVYCYQQPTCSDKFLKIGPPSPYLIICFVPRPLNSLNSGRVAS